MADQKGADEISEYSPGVVGNSNNNLGECSGLRLSSNNGIDDSGTESGEEVRVLKPEVIQEVQTALSRLEDVIPGLDPTKRNAVSQLVNSLQTCLKIPPPNPPPIPPPRRYGSKKSLRNRHTVGVTREELADARRWIDEHDIKRHSPQNLYGSSDSVITKVFRPVKFIPPIPVIEEKVSVPNYLTRMTVVKKQYLKPLLHRAGYFMEPGPQKGNLSYIQSEPSTPVESITSEIVQDSLFEYDPSLNLFTPEQTVQIAIHKAAINKQISREEIRRRGSSEDGDVSSGDDDNNNNLNSRKEMSSAQRLLQIATDDKSSETNKSTNRGTKKMKMKRSNTIDIPKPSNFYDYSSDDYGASADEGLRKAYDDLPRHFGKEKKIIPSFEPKTENDLKFLAFLKQVNNNDQQKVQSYNPCARGGKHWQSRFSTIKTAFEGQEMKPTQPPNAAKLFWQNSQNNFNNSVQTKTTHSLQSKLPWTVKTEENGVVVGSLTVSKPGHVNHFKHAAISAFKPIEKKQSSVVSPVSGSVKQIAAQKFSATPTPDYSLKSDKNYKYPQTKTNNLNYIKNDSKKSSEIRNFPVNSNVTQKTYSTAYHAPVQDTKSRSIINNKFLNEKPKQEQSNHKDNQGVKLWSYQKLDRKEPLINANTQFKTFESEAMKEPKYTSNYAKNIGRQFETPPSPINKKSVESIPSQNWSNNSNFVHYNNVTNREIEDRNKFQHNSNNYQFNAGGIYNKLPFVNDHLPSVHNRYKSEINGRDSSHNEQKNPQIKTSLNRNYFSDLNERNSSLVNITTPLATKEKQRFSLPENKLIDQYKDHTFKSKECIEKIRPLELHISQNETKKLISPHLLNYNSYPDRICENDRKQTIVIPQALIVPDKSAEYKMTHSALDYINDSPSSSCLLSPEDNVSSDTPQHVINSPQFTFSSDDRISPNEIIQKTSLSPQFSSYPQNFNTFERISPTKLSPCKISNDNFIPSYDSQHSKSPSVKFDDSNSDSPYLWVKDSLESYRRSLSNDNSNLIDENCTEEKAITKVMGQAQCQQAVTINNRTKTRYDSPKNIESELKLQLQQSARQKTLSPSFPNVLQKSESWHQMVLEQMHQAKQAPPLPKLAKAKSSHTLALPKQFEAALAPESITHKKMTVSQYLSKQSAHSKKVRQSSQISSKSKPSSSQSNIRNISKVKDNTLDDDLDNVDEVFESIFQESSKKRNSK